MDEKIRDIGLTSEKARQLLKEYGLNEIKSKRRFTFLKSAIDKFNNFFSLLLLFAATISFFLGEKVDGYFILSIVILNAAFGLYQEHKAEKSLTALKKMIVKRVRVIRDGHETEIDTRLLVPEDVIYIEEGTNIPADCILVKSWNLEVNESSLTGESMPLTKNEKNREESEIFMGTIIAAGRAWAKVVKTGVKTRFGQIAESLEEIEEVETTLEKKLNVFSKQVGLAGLAAASIVFILTYFRDRTLFESFFFAASLAVAAVPEGLPAVVTITLALGVEKMAKKGAIVRRLNAIEALGNVTLIATDKTGTLTTGKMRVKKIWVNGALLNSDNPRPNHDPTFSRLLENSSLCSTASLIPRAGEVDFDVVGDETEGAILLFVQKNGIDIQTLRSSWKIIDEKSFDKIRKRMIVRVQNKNQRIIFAKGSPESILDISHEIEIKGQVKKLTDSQKKQIEKDFKDEARRGYRLIALSYKKSDTDKNLDRNHIFLGFVALSDPVRDEVPATVSRVKKAGIKVVMITGDNEFTANSVALEAGIIKKGEGIITGDQLDKLSDETLLSILPSIKIFARTTPLHKYRLVRLYQKLKEVVVVTGDGVNDAPALKQADVGVAMGKTGTDVARETAEIVITDDNFQTLVTAIESGRNIFKSIKNATRYLLTGNSAEVSSVLITAILGYPPILTALQILYINLLSDGLPALSLSFAPHDGETMQKKNHQSLSFLYTHDYKKILYIGGIGSALTIISFFIGLHLDGSTFAMTMAFTTLTLVQPFILAHFWISGKSIFRSLNLFLKPVFLIAFFLPFILHPVMIYHPFFREILKLESLNPGYLILGVIISLLIVFPLEFMRDRNITS